MSGSAIKLKVSKATAECISPGAPREMRLLAASGKLPVEPKELLVALYILAHDKDAEIAREAQKSIRHLPPHLLPPLLASPEAHPKMIDLVSRLFPHEGEVLEAVVRAVNTETATLARIAGTADAPLLSIMTEQKEKLVADPAIAEAIGKNPAASPELLADLAAVLGAEGDEPLPEELVKENEGAPLAEEEKGSLYAQILKMGVSQKIKLAITGNKEARSILVKEPNRLICGNVVKNPRVTESEIVLFSASKTVGEEVFRLITANREYMRNYQVKLNLVQNPRVPLPTAMSLLNHIHDKDLAMVAKSRNVSKGIANMAARMLASKRAKKEKK